MKTLTGMLAAALLVLCAQPALCHEGRGGMALEPRPSTRAISMGEAGLAETGSAAAFAVNPSCLPSLATLQAGLAHGNLIDGVPSSATCFSIALPFGTETDYLSGEARYKYGLGLSVQHEGFELAQGSGWSSQTVSLGLGYSPAPYLSAGIVTKTLFSTTDLADVGVRAYGIDVGTRLELTPRIDLGLVIRNILGAAKWDNGEDETVPAIFNLGGTVRIPYGMSAELAMAFAGTGGSKIGLGIDAPILETGFHVRGGYLHMPGDYSRSIMAAGFGFHYLRYRLAYAVRVDDENAFGVTHHISLSGDLR